MIDKTIAKGLAKMVGETVKLLDSQEQVLQSGVLIYNRNPYNPGYQINGVSFSLPAVKDFCFTEGPKPGYLTDFTIMVNEFHEVPA